MPISRREFERGEIKPALFILEFLKSNSDTAYSPTELLGELASQGLSLSEEDLADIMRSLETQQIVESKTIEGVVYCIYSRPKLGFK